MDKGFFSHKNISFLLDGKEHTRFLLAVPFTTQFAKNAVAQVRTSLDNPVYAIPVGRESIQGVMKELDWDATHRLYTHVYYNMIKAAEIKSGIYGYVASLVTLAEINPDDPRYCQEFRQYLSIRKSEKTGRYRITIRRDVVEAELSHAGWMVLISNHIKDPKEAFHIYRAKDVVEKGFSRLKNDLDFHRLRIHSDTAMRGKLFVGFISLILLSHIHTIMLKYDMYKKWTLKELIRQLEKLHVQYISGNRILFPLTKSQKEIFRNFGIDPPV
jgi:transposase